MPYLNLPLAGNNMPEIDYSFELDNIDVSNKAKVYKFIDVSEPSDSN